VTPSLDVHLFDQFRVRYRGVPVEGVRTARLQALVCYLVVNAGHPQPRSRLASTFWPESTEGQARTNLRQLLHHLRGALPDPDDVLAVDHLTVRFKPDVRIDTDVDRFLALIARADRAAAGGDQAAQIDALERAVAEYRGDLLPGCHDEWLLAERGRLQELYRGALQKLAELLEEAQQLDRGIGYGRKLLDLDPLDERSCRGLVRMLVARGDRTSAQRIYHRLVDDLDRELGVAPSAETQALFARLVQSRRTAAESPPESAADVTPPEPLEAVPPLIGRRQEWLRLLHLWHSVAQSHSRFVVISGAMGAGKTRLAEELLRVVRRRDATAALARCFSSAGSLPLAPVREWLRSEALAPGLARLDRIWLSEVGRLIPDILTRHGDLPEPEPLRDAWQRQRFFEALARAALARSSPLLLALDDLQECDDETMDWLHFLLRFEAASPFLVLATLRDEDLRAGGKVDAVLRELRREDRVTEIALGPLSLEAAGELAEHILRRREPARIRRRRSHRRRARAIRHACPECR
jgi:DNA-binding SARP family transcriptional activator